MQTRALPGPVAPGPLVPALTAAFGRALLLSPDPLARAFGAAILIRSTVDLITGAIADLQLALAALR